MSNGDITVLVDSDTVWTPGTLVGTAQAVRRRVRRRRHDPPAHPRADALLDHPLGRLARELPRAVLDARAERPRADRLPARPHDRVPPEHPGARHGPVHARGVHGGLPRGVRRPDAHEPDAQGGLPDRLPVHLARVHGRSAAGEEAVQAAAPLGPRLAVQHAADAALDARPRADPGRVLPDRHHPAVHALRRDRGLDLPGAHRAGRRTSTRGSCTSTASPPASSTWPDSWSSRAC